MRSGRTLPSVAAGPAATVVSHWMSELGGGAARPEEGVTMARIGVQSEDLRQQASAVKAGAAEVNDILGRLTGQIQTLASTWEGAASAAFQTRWQEWQAGAAQVQQAMDGMGIFLDQAAQTYEETEESLRAAAGR